MPDEQFDEKVPKRKWSPESIGLAVMVVSQLVLDLFYA